MDTPIEEPKRISRKGTRRDIKVGTLKHYEGKASITKKEFEKTLVRVFTRPVSGKPLEGDQEVSQTSVVHPSDGYIGKRKNRDKIEGKED